MCGHELEAQETRVVKVIEEKTNERYADSIILICLACYRLFWGLLPVWSDAAEYTISIEQLPIWPQQPN